VPSDEFDAPTPAARPIANEDRLLALGRAIERQPSAPRRSGRRRPRSRRAKWFLRGGIAFTSVIVLLVLAVIALYLYFGSLLNHTPVPHLQSQKGADLNILLVGSTNRCALKVQNPAYGLCQDGVTGINSDIVMVVHLDPNTHSVALLSIPRDLFEPNAREANAINGCEVGFSFCGANKIDAALVEGPGQLTEAIEEDFGIPINHYIELNFDTFANVVNALHGIDMWFPRRVYDAESGLNIERPGCYHLNGVHALQVVRARHLFYQQPGQPNNPADWTQEAESDLARIRRTHEFLRVVATKIASMGIYNFSEDLSLASAILPDLTVDNGFSENEMISLARTYAGTKIAGVPEYTYPVILNFADPQDDYDYLYEGGNYGDVEFPVQPGGWQTVDQIFGATGDQSPWNYKSLPLPSAFKISVENGTGVTNQAAIVASQLGHKGYRVTSTGNLDPPATTSETTVWYGGPPPPTNSDWHDPSLEYALRVLTQLQGPVTLGYDPTMVTRGDAVTIETGTNISVATRDWTTTTTTTTTTLPNGATTSTAKAGTTTTTSAVTATTVYDPPGVNKNNDFSAPSDVAQPLEPWDPRACPPGMPVWIDRS
jgi:LCP family protein required for cell wall assembly